MFLQAKYEHALKHDTSINIVTPSWVTDCIKNTKRLSETLYRPAKGMATYSSSSRTAGADDKSTAVAKATSDEPSDNESSSKVTEKMSSMLSRPLSPSSITSTKAEVSSATVTEEVRSTKVAETPTSEGKRGMQDVREDFSAPSTGGKLSKESVGGKSDTPTREEKDKMFSEFEGDYCS